MTRPTATLTASPPQPEAPARREGSIGWIVADSPVVNVGAVDPPTQRWALVPAAVLAVIGVTLLLPPGSGRDDGWYRRVAGALDEAGALAASRQPQARLQAAGLPAGTC
jgi:hypothetical protein